MRVVSWPSCRSSWPISDKVAPERRSSVARLCRKLMCVAADASAIEGGLGDHCNRATGCKADVRRQRAQKQSATRRRRAAIPEIGNNGRANVWRKRHPRSLPTLGANEHLAGSPVDIIQSEGRNLASPQAQPCQHYQDCVVPPPQCRRSIAAVEDLLNLRGGQIGWQSRELPSPDGGYAAGQGQRVQSFIMEVSEKCAQRPAHRLPGTGA